MSKGNTRTVIAVLCLLTALSVPAAAEVVGVRDPRALRRARRQELRSGRRLRSDHRGRPFRLRSRKRREPDHHGHRARAAERRREGGDVRRLPPGPPEGDGEEPGHPAARGEQPRAEGDARLLQHGRGQPRSGDRGALRRRVPHAPRDSRCSGWAGSGTFPTTTRCGCGCTRRSRPTRTAPPSRDWCGPTSWSGALSTTTRWPTATTGPTGSRIRTTPRTC